jgi:hypothetical protein
VTTDEPPQPPPGDHAEWHGPMVPYDLVKEFVIALGVVLMLTVILSLLLSSPDEKSSTIAQWSRSDPGDFLTTATAELSGQSDSAQYGPPYTHTPDVSQKIGPVTLARIGGVTHPVNPSRDFVIAPLSTIPRNPALRAALGAYVGAPAARQAAWADAYTKAIPKAHFPVAGPQLPPGNYGPVEPIMSSLLGLAQSGGLDGALLTSRQFYETDYTKPLLLMADGGVLTNRATAQHLLGEQWGMMNETGSYPGQSWLWLYTFWYQIKPFSTSDNADALVWAVMAVLSLAFICIPFIPGVRGLPRRLGVHKLIWREHYRTQA